MILVDNQWETVNVLDVGGNGIVFRTENIHDGTVCAMKINIIEDLTAMRRENVVFDALDDAGNPLGFPTRLFTYSSVAFQPQRFLGLELLGPSLYGIQMNNEYGTMPMESVLMFGRQAIRRLQTLHALGFVHGDVKPNNFLMGHPEGDEAGTVHLIDFGASDPYMTDVNGRPKHIRFLRRTDTQTLGFGSRNGTRGYSISRRDDLESLIYTMIFQATGHLPWENLADRTDPNVVKQVWRMKQNIPQQQLFANLPAQLLAMYRHVRGLRFSQEPDYDYMYDLLSIALREIQAVDGQVTIG